MGKEYQEIDERMQSWIDRQRMFFVSTAPLADDGRINCSPKIITWAAAFGLTPDIADTSEKADNGRGRVPCQKEKMYPA